jgi:hypothetical protein
LIDKIRIGRREKLREHRGQRDQQQHDRADEGEFVFAEPLPRAVAFDAEFVVGAGAARAPGRSVAISVP